MPEAADLQRLRKEYSDRSQRLRAQNVYSVFNRAFLFLIQQREQALLNLINQNGLSDFTNQRILEIGCGGGGVLLEFLRYGVEMPRLTGIDLLHDRLAAAHRRLPGAALAGADGQTLPFCAGQFDWVLQYMAFSSILDGGIKTRIALDMLRVLKPHGAIVWYDFWLNPTNRQTKGIAPAEIRGLFPGCTVELHKITLAPPLARRIVPWSWDLGRILESLSLFNSHYLALIRPGGNPE